MGGAASTATHEHWRQNINIRMRTIDRRILAKIACALMPTDLQLSTTFESPCKWSLCLAVCGAEGKLSFNMVTVCFERCSACTFGSQSQPDGRMAFAMATCEGPLTGEVREILSYSTDLRRAGSGAPQDVTTTFVTAA